MKSLLKKKAGWFLIAFIIKLFIFIIHTGAFHSNWPEGSITKGIWVNTNDTKDYYQPIERLLNGEGYSLKTTDDEGVSAVRPWAFRMPGLLPIYAPLNLILGGEWAKFFIIILQFFLEVICVLLLAQCARWIFNNKTIAAFCFIFYLFSIYVSIHTNFAASESFCTSFFIVSFYFFIRYIQHKNKKRLFVSGFFLCWSIFFRPTIMFMAIAYPIILLILDKKNGTFSIGSFFQKSFILFSFFIFFDAIWIVRNYKAFDRFVPLNDSFSAVASAQEIALYNLIIAWGEDIQDWNPSAGRWFVRPTNSTTRVYDSTFQKTNPFPPSVFTQDYNLDSLKSLRQIYWKTFAKTENDSSAYYYRTIFVQKSTAYLQSYKSNKPFQYYVLNKFKFFKRFLFIKVPYGTPFTGKNIFNKAIRGLQLLLYYFIILSAIAGVFLVWKRKLLLPKLVSLLAILFIFIHVWFGYVENRYLVPLYPILVLFSAYFFYSVIEKRQFFKRITNKIDNFIIE